MKITIVHGNSEWSWRVEHDDIIAHGEAKTLAECFAKIDPIGVAHIKTEVSNGAIQLVTALAKGIAVLATAFFLSSAPPAQAKGDVNGGISAYWAGDNNPVEWGHSLPRTTVRGFNYTSYGRSEETVKVLETQSPIPYLIDISRLLDPYVWIFNKRPEPKEIQWFKKRSEDSPWPPVVAGIASAMIAGACMLLPFALLNGKKSPDKDESV